jgi:hypothetical protein
VLSLKGTRHFIDLTTQIWEILREEVLEAAR